MEAKKAEYRRKLDLIKPISRWKWFWMWVWYLISMPFKWIWVECHDWRTLLIFVIVFLAFSGSVWVWYVLAAVTWGSDFSKWAIGIGSTVWLFWIGPFTPFLPLCIATTAGIKALFDKIKRRKGNG